MSIISAIAHGPAFKKGLLVEPLQNIHLYNLMAYLLSLQPAPNDGHMDSVRVMLKEPHVPRPQ